MQSEQVQVYVVDVYESCECINNFGAATLVVVSIFNYESCSDDMLYT